MSSVGPRKAERPEDSVLHSLAGSDANLIFLLLWVWRIQASDFPDSRQIVRFRFLTLSLLPMLLVVALVAESAGLTWLPQVVAGVYSLVGSRMALTAPENGFLFRVFVGEGVQRRPIRRLIGIAIFSATALFLFFNPSSVIALFGAFCGVLVASAIWRGARHA